MSGQGLRLSNSNEFRGEGDGDGGAAGLQTTLWEPLTETVNADSDLNDSETSLSVVCFDVIGWMPLDIYFYLSYCFPHFNKKYAFIWWRHQISRLVESFSDEQPALNNSKSPDL